MWGGLFPRALFCVGIRFGLARKNRRRDRTKPRGFCLYLTLYMVMMIVIQGHLSACGKSNTGRATLPAKTRALTLVSADVSVTY